MRAGALALALVGCIQPPPRGSKRPPEPADLYAIELVASAAYDLNYWSTRCGDELSGRIAVVDADDASMRYGVGYCAAGGPICDDTLSIADTVERQIERARRGCSLGVCVGGAFQYADDDLWPVNLTRQRADLYISAYIPEPRRTDFLVHEATHWVSACSTGFADEAHANPDLWGADGVERTALRGL